LQGLTASLERIEELLRISPSVKDGSIGDIGSGALGISFHNVSFGYTTDQLILQNVSLSLEPGEVLGLLGRTGSGKTTLTRLIFRLYELSTGMIQLNGVDLRNIRLSVLRHRVGLVTQDVQLFAATIRDNLTLFNAGIPDSQILAVVGMLGPNHWLAAQRDGLNTLIDAGGKNLSAGEAQLLAFARVYLRGSVTRILDEASSRLDAATEASLEHATAMLLQNRTAIIIAHRLNTLSHADKIAIIDAGMVIEFGRRAELSADPSSRFYRLLTASREGMVE
jgi:ATP-binding cassette, subfamily B, bacterial